MAEKRTYADRREYLIKAVAKRRQSLKRQAVEYKGGTCQICGYDRCISALDFHHLDDSKKKFGLSKDGITRSWDSTREELQNCVLVCSNCHREIHAGMLQPPKVISDGNMG